MCAHGLVRTEGGGFHHDPMWFHASIFSGVGSPASHGSSPEWAFGLVARRKGPHVVLGKSLGVPLSEAK
jgi:hypothetical protein